MPRACGQPTRATASAVPSPPLVTGIAEGDLHKATVGAVTTAGKGTASTAVDTGRSHLRTTKGVVKDTGKTVEDTGKAAGGE